jgi:hypothetical protein
MNERQHLRLPLFSGNVERQKSGGGGGFSLPKRDKIEFLQQAREETKKLDSSLATLKTYFAGIIDPSLIFEIEINQSVYVNGFDDILNSMGIHILSIAEGKKGYWVVFSEDEDLSRFKRKLETYGSEDGPNYDFFHAIESFHDIPVENKIGENLAKQPLGDTAEFIDLELWKMRDPQKMKTSFGR